MLFVMGKLGKILILFEEDIFLFGIVVGCVIFL